ncbi:MAG: MinD/ParA family ATP-binding protein [Nocardioides sp.]
MTETEQTIPSPRTPHDPPQPPGPGAALHWRTAPGLEHLGPLQGTALLTPHYLLRRADGQVVQLSELLHLVVKELTPPGRSDEEVVAAVSAAYGRRLTTAGLQHLVRTRLAPLGLVEDPNRPSEGSHPTSRPLLSLSLRGTILPPRWVGAAAGVLRWLFLPPLVIATLVAWVVLDVALVVQADLLAAFQSLLAAPEQLLLLYVVLTAGALFHELGHAAACRYGGARPGTIGFGVYLVFPAFYTDVTDSYRLGRAGRVRTDLGGLYFNVLALLLLGLGYLGTGNGLLLLAILVTHVQMIQQLIPIVRFDGYYILADLIGVPDLFARLRPTLSSAVPGRPLDPRVSELRPLARRLVLGWVLLVVPTLAVAFGWLLWHLPVMVTETILAGEVQVAQLRAAWTDGDVTVVLLSLISLVFLVLPLMGVAIVLARLAWSVKTALARGFGGTRRSASPPDLVAAPNRFTAAAFTDEQLLPRDRHVAALGWQRTLYRLSAHTIRLGPGAEERRRAERATALRAPIEGTRRVVVMSRKGGVGKTTISLALGSILATERGDRVVAVDANPDAGNLAHRVAPPSGRTITDVLRELDVIDSYAALKRYTSQAAESRLEVLASDEDSRIGTALDRTDYHRLIGLLDRFYNVILLDTGTGILDSANQGLLAEADELVLVLRAGVDGGRAASLTLDWLEAHGHAGLVRQAVVVINAVRPRVGAPIAPIRDHFTHRCRRVVIVPWDPALETGAQTMLSTLAADTQESLLEMAAAVAENFPASGCPR